MTQNKYTKFFLALIIFTILGGGFLYKHINPPSTSIPNWQISPYKEVKVESHELPLKISSLAGGLFFNYLQPIEEGSCLQIEGHRVNSIATLRLKYGDDDPIYMQAPEGALELGLSPASSIEVMIYGDSAFGYELDELTISKCKDVMTDAQFRKYIMGQIPDLEHALAEKDTLKAARLLLHWSAGVSDLGSKIPKAALVNSVTSLSASEIFGNIWEKDVGGGSCGAFACFYAKILHLFGIDSFAIDIGFDPSLLFTHVTTIVASHVGEKRKFYLFDPTADGTFVDFQGNYVDLETILNSYDKEAKVLRGNFWVAEACLLRDYTGFNDAGVLVKIEKNKPYDFGSVLVAWSRVAKRNNSVWADTFNKYFAVQNTNVIIDMLLNEVYRVGPALNSSSPQEFLDLLGKHNSKIP